MKKSKSIAFAGIFSALCVVGLSIGSIIQTLDLSCAFIGSLIILLSFIELGKKWAFGVYITSSIISLLWLPYKSPAIVFALFTGIYPIIKERLNRINPTIASRLIRFAYFNISACAIAIILVSFFNMDGYSEFEKLHPALLIGLLILLGNVVFYLYDLVLERASVYYIRKIRPKLFHK